MNASLGVLPFAIVIVAVLGSLCAGVAAPTEAGGVGSAMAILLSLVRGRLTWALLYESTAETVRAQPPRRLRRSAGLRAPVPPDGLRRTAANGHAPSGFQICTRSFRKSAA